MAVSPAPDCIYGVVGVIERDAAFLMIKRSAQVRAPGKWCFPGGHIEPGETPAAAIVREFHEELGLHVRPERNLWSWLRDDGQLHLEWWRVHLVGGALRPKPDEVAEARWLSDDDIRTYPDMIPNNVTFLEHYRQGTLPGMTT